MFEPQPIDLSRFLHVASSTLPMKLITYLKLIIIIFIYAMVHFVSYICSRFLSKKKEKENTIHVQVICTLAEYLFFLVQFNTR